jgi:uncharacterized phage protein (TIGR01671 family)
MTREIKFRAWDKSNKRFVPDDELQVHTLGANITSNGINRTLDILGIAYDLSQFTGLKDKNGKEIYEGDILGIWESTIVDDEMADKKNYEVEWGGLDYPAFTLDGWEYGEMNPLSEISMSGDWEYEVIGNIYENDDLLE